jgi:hypothetical protein
VTPGAPLGRSDRILFVGGVWGSGTTLLDLLLGELPGTVAVGELRQLWRSGVLEDRRCGCGEAFGACPFWREVGRVAFGGWSSVDAEAMTRRQRALDRPAATVRHALLRSSGRSAAPLVAALGRVVDAVRSVSGRSVVVDSSKAPGQAIALRAIPRQDVRLIMMVRDPRAVVYSQQRRAAAARERGEHPGPVVRRWALRWAGYNLLVPRLFPRQARAILVRYEDLSARPREWVARTAAATGLDVDPEDLAFIGEGSARLRVQHTVYGNPMRFAVGELPIRLDDAWTREMAPADRRAVTRMLRPLLGRYGYAAAEGRAPG